MYTNITTDILEIVNNLRKQHIEVKFIWIPSHCNIEGNEHADVPQGSVLGPLLFTLYVSPIASLVSRLGIQQHQYADDTQLHIAISKPTETTDIHLLESTLLALSSWFSHNWLALNPDKSDAILLGTQQRNKTLNISNVNVAGSIVPLSDHIKLLGVTIDNSLSFAKHASLVSQSCYYHIKSLRHIRHTLDTPTAALIGHALVSSRLDYSNSLLYNAPKSTILKLQKVQNTLARIVLQSDHLSPSKPLLDELHWLPIPSRIHFKIATLTRKALSTGTPHYLASLLQPYQPSRVLCSSSQSLLQPCPAHFVQ